MVLTIIIDVLYLLNETRKAVALIVLSPFGLLAAALMGLSLTGNQF